MHAANQVLEKGQNYRIIQTEPVIQTDHGPETGKGIYTLAWRLVIKPDDVVGKHEQRLHNVWLNAIDGSLIRCQP